MFSRIVVSERTGVGVVGVGVVRVSEPPPGIAFSMLACGTRVSSIAADAARARQAGDRVP